MSDPNEAAGGARQSLLLAGREAEIEHGAAAVVIGGETELEDAAAGVVISGKTEIEDSFVLLLLSGRTKLTGNSRVLLTTKDLIALGVAAYLLSRRRVRRR